MDFYKERENHYLQNGHEKFYRFHSTKDDSGASLLGQLIKNNIWVSDPEKFNDPFDLKLEIKNALYETDFDESEILWIGQCS